MVLSVPDPCKDPRMIDWAATIDQLFASSNPGWAIYKHGRGHHIQLIPALIDAASLANIRQALEKWGWKKFKRENDEVESWFYSEPWRNPCK